MMGCIMTGELKSVRTSTVWWGSLLVVKSSGELGIARLAGGVGGSSGEVESKVG